MEPVFYVMAIMGCGDPGVACQQARVEDARYASTEACEAAMPSVLARNTDLSYPTILASCHKRTNRVADADTNRTPAG